MTTIKAFVKSHLLMSFHALTFTISWASFLIAAWVGTGGFSPTPQQLQTLMPYAVPAVLLGPSVAGLLLTGLLYGRAGFRELLSRLLRWRVGARWYALAFLLAPLLFTAVLLRLALLSPEFLPRILTTTDKAALISRWDWEPASSKSWAGRGSQYSG